MRRACAITLTDDDRTTLEHWSRSRSTEARLVERPGREIFPWDRPPVRVILSHPCAVHTPRLCDH
jgi:hypothetical protein